MSKSSDKVLEVLKTKSKKKTNKSETIKKWLNREIWNGRPIKWLAIGLSYCAIAYATYSFSVYYINIPELNGIAAFIATFVIGSRAFRNNK